MDDEEDVTLANPFPSPPSHYAKYTAHNLRLLALIRERSRVSSGEPIEVPEQQKALSDQQDVPEWQLTQLEKPRVDWIRDEGYYTVFGQTWKLEEVDQPLAASGVEQLYPSDPQTDRRPALLSCLRSLLLSYSKFTKALLVPPRVNSDAPVEWRHHAHWMHVVATNIMAAVNELRPVQARGNLAFMMKRQLELRRQETQALHVKCDALEQKLAELRRAASIKAAETHSVERLGDDVPTSSTTEQLPSASRPVQSDDVLEWIEEII